MCLCSCALPLPTRVPRCPYRPEMECAIDRPEMDGDVPEICQSTCPPTGQPVSTRRGRTLDESEHPIPEETPDKSPPRIGPDYPPLHKRSSRRAGRRRAGGRAGVGFGLARGALELKLLAVVRRYLVLGQQEVEEEGKHEADAWMAAQRTCEPERSVGGARQRDTRQPNGAHGARVEGACASKVRRIAGPAESYHRVY